LDFTVRRRGRDSQTSPPRRIRATRASCAGSSTDAIRRDGWDASRIGEFEMEVRYAGDRRVLTTFVAADR
jgi:hypothetical protein